MLKPPKIRITTRKTKDDHTYEWIPVYGDDVGKENPVETKHLKLAIHLSAKILDKQLQPGPEDQKKLQVCNQF